MADPTPELPDVAEQLRQYVTRELRPSGSGAARQAASLNAPHMGGVLGTNAQTLPSGDGTQRLWIFNYDEYPKDDATGDGWFFGDEPLDSTMEDL